MQICACWLALRFTPLGLMGPMSAYVIAYFVWLLGYEVTFRWTLRQESAAHPPE